MAPPLAYTPMPNLVGRRGRRVGVGVRVCVGSGSGFGAAVWVDAGMGVVVGAAAPEEPPMSGKKTLDGVLGRDLVGAG